MDFSSWDSRKPQTVGQWVQYNVTARAAFWLWHCLQFGVSHTLYTMRRHCVYYLQCAARSIRSAAREAYYTAWKVAYRLTH